MAKPATRMKSIVLKSYSASRQRLAGPPASSASKKRKDCRALSVCADQPQLATHNAHSSGFTALREDLRATIEDMVIPRLLIGQSLPQSAAPLCRGRVLPTQAEVDLLSRIAVQPDLNKALELAFDMLGAGLSLQSVLLHLIGPAARRLGTDWEEDRRSFADVTVGLGTLHEMVHLLARRDASDAIETAATRHSHSHSGQGTVSPHRSALLVGGPGEQHTLGMYIFAELLRHSRWGVALETNVADSDLLRAVRSQSIDLVGIAVSSPERFACVRDLLHGLRRASKNSAVRVVVGGPVDLTREAERENVLFCSDAQRAIEWLDSQ